MAQLNKWQMQYEDLGGGQPDRREDISEPRSSPPASPCNSLNDIYDTRRSRACDACRNSKVRCEQPNPDLPCKRCAKARRECVSPTRGQKRRKSMTFSDQLVALGGKIDHLTKTLCPGFEGMPQSSGPKVSSRENLVGNSMVASEKHSTGHTPPSGREIPNPSSTEDRRPPQQPMFLPIERVGPLPEVIQNLKNACNIENVSDFVEKSITQIVSNPTAVAICQRYSAELAENVPAVIIHPSVSVPEIRSNKPILFLAILAVASGCVCDIDTQRRLRALISIVLSHCYLKDSEYTIELVQASIVLALWHTPSEPSQGQDAMDMEQLSHAAANIAIHIGLGKQTSNKIWDLPTRRYGQDSQRSKSLQLADDLEARRTWLGCYFICANTSMPSQQPNLLCWNQYMDECVELLETSPLALPSDKCFSKHIRLQRATEEHSRKIFASSLLRPASTSRPDTNEILDSFKRRMANCNNSVQNNSCNGSIQLLNHSSFLYVYEAVAIFESCATGAGPTYATSPTKVSPITECVDAAHNVVSVFTSLELQNIRTLPTIFLIRVIHAMIFLVRFGGCTKLGGPHRSTTSNSEDTKVEHQLDDMIEIMASWGSDWPACRLIQILIRLRKQLREKKSKTSATPAPLSRNSPTFQEGDDTQSSTPTFPELPTPSPLQSLPQQSYDFRPSNFPAPDDTTYGDLDFWDTFLEQGPQSKNPMSPGQGYTSLWNALQPQQQQQHYPLFSEDTLSHESAPATGLFSDNGQPECLTCLGNCNADALTAGKGSDLTDFTNQMMSLRDIDANLCFLDNAIETPH